ncbi:MAG: undecaprenyl-diphosphate phosphatase [Planctomycetaceae bacterium]|nr:undecaprenyl-diphosphate phosphatase [Planctomycetales bacterium]MCB9937583.1 undecaprenyl-diphosphate phosphatase [Planctomycetaceae bacterium]
MELSLTEIIVLAVVQGVTEFLPVSSSGHLVIVAALMADGDVDKLDVSDVNICLHGGTLISIVVFYWQRLWRLLSTDRGLIVPLGIATVPAVVIGLSMKATGADALLSSPLLAGCLLPVTGLILIWASRRAGGKDECRDLSYKNAALIGLSQALAILPGLSRSGTTISAGMRLGLAPTAAATFSFLMAIPVIGGACLLEILKLAKHASTAPTTGATSSLIHLGIGAAVSYTVGLVSLWLLVKWLERGRFQYFAAWCIPIGIGVIIWQLVR